LLLVAAVYLSRAAEEFFLFTSTPVIFASCVLVGAVYVALFVIALKTRRKQPAAGARVGSEDKPELHPVVQIRIEIILVEQAKKANVTFQI
jgi:hypothetical protein